MEADMTKQILGSLFVDKGLEAKERSWALDPVSTTAGSGSRDF